MSSSDPAGELFDRAVGLQRRNRLAEAVELYREILLAHPGHGDSWRNLGVGLKMSGDLDGAIEAFGRAIEVEPGRGEGHAFLGHALRDAGRVEEAIDAYGRGVEVSGDARTYDSMLVAMHGDTRFGRAELLEEHRRWREWFEPGVGRRFEHARERARRERMRVGYVAADLGDHPLGRFLLPLLENHDRGRFEIYCYNDYARPDGISERLRGAVERWQATGGLSHAQLAERIHEDGIDILIDLTMHAPGSRLAAFAQKPAPVQATYLAYASTTGLGEMDYRLSDSYLDPMGVDESLYSERTLRLAHCYWCYLEPSEAPEVGPSPANANGYITFGCPNSFSKTNLQMMGLWAEVLGRVGNSRLLIHAQEGGHRMRTKGFFASRGIEPGRIEFVGFQPLRDYFGTYGRIDVALDTYPWAGGTTTCDALWMGVPVVSLAGETAVSRGGLSILSNIGLGELAASRPEEFVRIAAGLKVERVEELRAGSRERMRGSVVMDGKRFARDVEEAFERMWVDVAKKYKDD